MAEHYLKKMFMPSSIAVFGANERADSVAGIVFNNILQEGFKGSVYPINPKYETVSGLPCYPSLEALNKPVDLAVIATPASSIPAIIESAGRLNVHAAVILSAGFSETGETGKKLEQAVVENARRYGLRFIACELPWIREMDINPLVVDERGAMAVDARIVVSHYPVTQRRYSHMAIHPYPAHWVKQSQLPGGVDLTIRPIRPEDSEMEKAFVQKLSEESRFFRFMYNLAELTPEMLTRFTKIDYDREMAFVAVVHIQDKETEIGVSRYTIETDGKTCEFAIVVADEWRQHGIAHKLMEQLMEYARYQGLETMRGHVLANNREMITLAKSLNFSVHSDIQDNSLILIVKKL
jgi:predicted CoA-binding protein/GNAT superfamily N-acetyltransferase